MVLFKNLQIVFSKLYATVKNALQFLVEPARAKHEHPFVLRAQPDSALFLNFSNDFALKNHEHDYVRRDQLVNEAYRIGNADSLNGYISHYFNKKDHKHDYAPKARQSLTVIANASANQDHVIVDSEPLHNVYSYESNLIWIAKAAFVGDGWRASLAYPLPVNIPAGKELRAVDVLAKADTIEIDGVKLKPRSIFARLDHSHKDAYYAVGERVIKSRRLAGVRPSSIAPLNHAHLQYVRKGTTRYKPKTAIAEKAKQINGRKICCVTAQPGTGTLTANVRIDILEAIGAPDLPSHAYATQLSPQYSLQFYMDAARAFQENISGATVYQVKLSSPAMTFLEELSEKIPILPKIPTTLYQITLFSKHFAHIVSRQVVPVPDMALEVFLTPGGPHAWNDFEKYTINLQRYVFSYAAQYSVVIKRTPDLMTHLQAKVRGIAGNQIIVENCGLPYALLAFTKAGGGIKREDTAFGLSE